jgi:hypothetical protein
MTAFAWLVLIPGAEPAAKSAIAEFSRAGIVCIESVAPAEVPLISEIRLTLSADGDAPLAVEAVMFRDPPGWQVRATEPATILDRPGGKQQWRQTFRLAPDKPGELSLRPPAVKVRVGARETPVQIDWPPLVVRVTTMLPRVDLDEARGVTGPEPAPPAPPPYWKDERVWAAAIVLVAIVATLLAGRSVRMPPAPELPPAEWAAAGLDRLARLDPAEPATADGLAGLLRGYLARRYQFPAEKMTSAELLSQWPGDSEDDWRLLLERCDLARFAKFRFSTDEWVTAIGEVRRLTLPVGEAADSTMVREGRQKA